MTIHIPQNIKYLLSVNKVSRNALADICNVNPVTISHWTAGRQSPKIEQLLRIARHFKISLDDLVSKQLTMGNGTNNQLTEPDVKYGNRVSLLEEISNQMSNQLKAHDQRLKDLENRS